DKKEIDSYINNIKNNLHNQENIINFEKRKKLTDKLKELEDVQEPKDIFIEQDLFNTIEHEKEIDINRREYNSLSIPYQEGEVEKEIERIKNSLKYQDILLQIEKRNTIINRLKEIPEITPSE